MNETELEIHLSGIKDQQVVQNQTSLLAGIRALQQVNELVAAYGSKITDIRAGLEDSLNATTQAEIRIKRQEPGRPVLHGRGRCCSTTDRA